jgi:signal transduction histidine kinase
MDTSQKNYYVSILFFRIALLLSAFWVSGVEFTHAASVEKRILLISSYHPDYPTFFKQIDGVKKGLEEAGFRRSSLVLDIEFMDTKRFYSDEAVSGFYDRLEKKLSMLPPYDLILTADDIGTKSAIQRQTKLFKNTPIIFFSVNDRDFSIKQNQNSGVTGVVEAMTVGKTAELATRLFSSQPLVVIIDETPTGQGILAAFKEQVGSEIISRSQILSLGDLTFEELKKSLRSFSKDYSLLLLSSFRDKTGMTISSDETLEMVVSNFSGPVFFLWEYGLGQGVIGGVVISHFQQGKAAALLAASVLKGTPISTLNVVENSPNIPLFDYQVVQQFGVSPDHFPPETIFINKPSTGIVFSKTSVIITGLIVGFLVIFSILIFISKSRLRKLAVGLQVSESKLRHSNVELEKHRDNLSEMVEERSKELKNSQLQLIHSEKLSSLGKLTVSISHEFNNPLQGIRTAITILSKSALSDKEVKLAKAGKKECDRMAKMINGLRDFYKPTSGKFSFIDINQCLEEVLTLQKETLKNRGLQVNQQFSDNLPKVEVVEDQIKQVILNLVQNAADSISGEGQITLTTEKLDSHLLIQVQDTGAGISEDGIKHIFEPFYTTKNNEKGTGLGLSISYGIIKDHGGKIEVISKLDKGATFMISLPIKRV